MRRLLLTAPRGAGKTTALLDLLDRRRAAGLSTHGMISPGVYVTDGSGETHKKAIDLLLLPEGTRTGLAVPRPRVRSGREGRERSGGMDGELGFDFHPEAVAAADRHFEQLSGLKTAADRFVIVDEIGPLEIVRGEGIRSALSFLDDDARLETAVITARPEIVEMLLSRWPGAEVVGPGGLLEALDMRG